MISFIILIFIFWLYMLVTYIVNSIAYYRIAQKRNVSAPILAWIPIAMKWTVGAITDSFDNERNLNRKWRVTLLLLNIIELLLFVLFFVMLFVGFLGIGLISVFAFGGDLTDEQAIQSAAALIPSLICLTAFSIVSSISTFCGYICIYKIFEGANPKNSVKYILLSFFIPFAFSVCLYKCSNTVPSLRLYETSYDREFMPKAVKYYKETQDNEEKANL